MIKYGSDKIDAVSSAIWNTYNQVVFYNFYYKELLARFILLRLIFNITSGIISTVVISLMFLFPDLTIVWTTLLLVAEIAVLLIQQLNFSVKIYSLNLYASQSDALTGKARNAWNVLQCVGAESVESLVDLDNSLNDELDRLDAMYILPIEITRDNGRLFRKASDYTDEHMERAHCGKTQEEGAKIETKE